MEKKYESFKEDIVCFSGFLSSNPEIKYYESGKCKTTFSLPLKHKGDDEPVWLNCECWGKRGEQIVNDYQKGDEITVMGVFRASEYKDKQYVNFVVKMWG